MSHPAENDTAIGIDFGTTFCRAATLDKGIQLLQNDEYERRTAVYLTFNDKDGTAKFGNFVERYFEESVNQTLFGIKHLLHDGPAQPTGNYIASYDHEVRSLQKSNNHSKTDMYTIFLKEMKRLAERHRDTTVRTAFITVPAFFQSPSTDLVKAAEAAGFENVRFIQETMAAAVAYAFENKIVFSQPLMVFSLGGGFLEAAFFHGVSTTNVSLSPGCLISEAFDCGGEEFTQCMIHLLARRCREETGHDLLAKPKMRRKVRLEAGKLKESLQKFNSASFEFQCVSHDCDFTGEVRVTDFNHATEPLVNTIRERLKSFKDTVPHTVKEIVLVGGSTRLKCVRKVLRDTFPGASLKESVNPDEAAVCGAAVLAHFFKKGELQFEGNNVSLDSKKLHTRPLQEGPLSDARSQCYSVEKDALTTPEARKKHVQEKTTFTEIGKSFIDVKPPGPTPSRPIEIPIQPSLGKAPSGYPVHAQCIEIREHDHRGAFQSTGYMAEKQDARMTRKPTNPIAWWQKRDCREPPNSGDSQCGGNMGRDYRHTDHGLESNTEIQDVSPPPKPSRSLSWWQRRDSREQPSSGGKTHGNFRRNDIPSKEQDRRTKPKAPVTERENPTGYAGPPDNTPSSHVDLSIREAPPSGSVTSMHPRESLNNSPKEVLKNRMSAPKPSVVKVAFAPNQSRHSPYNTSIGYGVGGQQGISHYPARPIAETKLPVPPRHTYLAKDLPSPWPTHMNRQPSSSDPNTNAEAARKPEKKTRSYFSNWFPGR